MRRTLVAARRVAPAALALASLVFAMVLVRSASAGSQYRSQGAVELVAPGGGVAANRLDLDLGDAAAEILRFESEEFQAEVAGLMGEQWTGVLSLTAGFSGEDSSIVVITAVADEPTLAPVAVDASIQALGTSRSDAFLGALRSEAAALVDQRRELLLEIDALSADLASSRASGNLETVDILEARVAASLRRIADYDRAVQEREFLASTTDGDVRIVRSGSAADTVRSLGLQRGVQLALLTALLVSAAYIVTSRIRGTIYLQDELIDYTDGELPLLAVIPRFRRSHRGRNSLVVGRRNARREAEAFRYLRSAIEVGTEGMSPVSIVFTSARPNEGKTVTAANYALAVARAGTAAAVLDGDLLNPSVAPLFGRTEPSGLPSLMSGVVDPSTENWPLISTGGESLTILGSASATNQSSERLELAYRDVEAAIQKLSHLWTPLVIDCPPLLSVSDSIIIARAATSVVVVVRMGKSRRREVAAALKELSQNGCHVLGLVATFATLRGEAYYGSDYWS